MGVTASRPGTREGTASTRTVKEGTDVGTVTESVEVNVPVSTAYNQWTQYQDWPTFMKKVEHAEQEPDEPTVKMKAQVFLSHRSWEATIKDQIPDERIIWRSTGQKGYVDGCVSFHEIGAG